MSLPLEYFLLVLAWKTRSNLRIIDNLDGQRITPGVTCIEAVWLATFPEYPYKPRPGMHN